MDLERERGITIKLQPVRMRYEYALVGSDEADCIGVSGGRNVYAQSYRHSRARGFSLRSFRSLAAVEGAILLVDATKGVQA